jgi:hypothetical protein
MTKVYRVLLRGLLVDGDTFKAGMRRLGVTDETVEELMKRAPIVLKANLALGEARRYAEAVQAAGGKVKIEHCGWAEDKPRASRSAPIAPLKDFIMCPECGFKQPKGVKCAKCGFRLKKGGREEDRENVAGY